MNNKNFGVVSGCISVYILALVIYYIYEIFNGRGASGFFSDFKVIYLAAGASAVYAVNHFAKSRATIIIGNITICSLYIITGQLLNESGFCGDLMFLTVILCAAAIGFKYYKPKREKNIIIFEGSAAILIAAAAVIEGRSGNEISMLPIITGIGLGLAESTRLSFVDRAIDSRKFLIGANLITYFTCAVFGSLIIIFRDYIIKGAAAFGTLIADGARLCVEVFKRIITFLSGLFNMRNSEIFEQVGREQSEGRADFNGWILLGAGIILVSALIVGAVALIIKIRKQKVSDEELTVLYIKKKRWKEDKIKKREVKEINRRGRAFNIKYFFMRANNPEIFMYKMKRVLRKTDYKMLSSESPRQVFNKFLKTELISDELKKSMNNMADIVDRYYYAEEKGDLYKREEGEILLSKIRKESRRKR